jgi:hypothetical protein
MLRDQVAAAINRGFHRLYYGDPETGDPKTNDCVPGPRMRTEPFWPSRSAAQ